jgi:ribosomal protein L10
VFTDYRGMTVAELSELRRLLRDGNSEYKIVKNTLAKIASKDTAVSTAKESFMGPIGIAIGYDDPILVVKKILEYSKKNEKLKLSSGVIEGKFCASDDLRTIADIPPKNVLLSMIAGCLTAPLNNLAYALSATVNKFACIMEALKEKRAKVQ